MKIDIDPTKIRIWSKNPRYTDFANVIFKEIGKDDFEIGPFNEVKDVYYDNLEKYYLELINGYDKLRSMLSLLESLSNGFNPNIDEIIVTDSPFLLEKQIFDKKNSFYYSLEGNRRIFALNILLNTKNNSNNGSTVEARQIICSFIHKKYPNLENRLKKILDVFDSKDNVKTNFNEFEVKFLSVEKIGEDEIWRTLNARHFGKRKGKMNWPRGLVLSAISSKIEKIRNDLKLNPNDEIEGSDFDKVIKNLENFTGKEISTRDLQMALWTTYCSNIYNSQKNIQESEKITYKNTEEEGNEINDNFPEILDNQEKEMFKISSLELSMSTIKILSDQGIYETLAKVIGLNIDIKRWNIQTKSIISKEALNALIIYIINLIKSKKLNTRFFDQDYENEIKKIISLTDNDKEQLDYLIKKDINKINPKFAPLSLLIKKEYEKKLDFSNYTEQEKNEYLKKSKSIIDNIIPILNRIITLENTWKDEIENLNNNFQYALITIWITELNSILKNKEITSIWNFPLLIFSSSLRSTGELLMLMLIKNNISNNDFDNVLAKKESLSQKDLETLNIIEKEYPTKIEGWIKSTEMYDAFTSPFIKHVYKTFFINKLKDTKETIFIAKDSLQNELTKINEVKINKKDDLFLQEMSKKLNWFICWSIQKSLDLDHGASDILNSLIHTPSLIKNIHNDSTKFEKLSFKFDEKINIIIKFIEFILS